jgi:hypothetical protein
MRRTVVPENGTLDLFYDLFRGNPSFFVKHQAPFTEQEGKRKAAWCGFAVYNKRNPPPEGKENGDLIPVTKKLYQEHLNGGDGLAIAPLMNTQDKRNVCFYAVLDIDVYGVNFTWLVNRLYRAGFKFAAFLSKSGGLHIYFFFGEPEPGDKVIETLEKIAEVYGLGRLFVNEKNKGKVEIFPKQAAFVPGDKNVNCLFLPFYNAANKSRQNMLTAEGKLLGIKKALPVIADMFTSVKELNSTLDGLPYGDAPYCIQMLLLTGALQEGDFRDNFLCCTAIYFKKKSMLNGEGVDFLDDLREANRCLESPLEDNDVQRIYKSMTEKGYDKYWCNKPPCKDYCNKSLCRLRENGIGQSKNNISTGADCWGALSRVMTEEPYYIWEVRVNPEDPYKKVRFDSEDDVLNQAVVQRRCMRDLNWVPTTVKKQVWDGIVRGSLQGIEERQIAVPRETDTTETGVLRRLFVRYLAHRQIQNGQPYMLKTGQVYHAEGVYYFTTEGIMTFLRFEKFSLGKINLREQLKDYGCSDGELAYKTAKGVEKTIECWKKPDDAELLEMDAFYEEVYAGDADIQREDTVDTGWDEGGGDEGVKF